MRVVYPRGGTSGAFRRASGASLWTPLAAGPAVGGQMRRVRLSPVGHVSGVRSPDARRCAARAPRARGALPSYRRVAVADGPMRPRVGRRYTRETTHDHRLERWMRNINNVSAAKA